MIYGQRGLSFFLLFNCSCYHTEFFLIHPEHDKPKDLRGRSKQAEEGR